MPSPPRPLRAAPYSRVSEDKTHRERSVEQQDTDNLAVIAREGWTPVLHPDGRPWRDNDKGASRSAVARRVVREDWQQLLDLIDRGQVDVIVIWELSRSTRARKVWAALIEACIDRGVLMSVGGKTHDPADPDDGFFLDLGMGLAVRESAITRKRVMRDQASAAAAGRPHGKIPYGYRREYDPDSGALLRQVVREDQAAVVREAYRRILGGEPATTVAADLNARGVPSPGGVDWSRNTLLQILHRPTMAGLRVYRGQVAGPAAWPPIVSEDDWFALQAKYRCAANDPEHVRRDGAVKHLATGIVRCAACRGELAIHRDRGRQTYRCGVRYCTSAPVDGLERRLSALAVARLSRADARDLFVAADDGAARAAQDELDALQARLDSFTDAAADGGLTPSALGRIEAKLLPQIAAAQARARVAGVPAALQDLLGAADVAAAWGALPLGGRRDVLRAFTATGDFLLARSDRRGPYPFDGARLKFVPRSAPS